MELPVQTNPWKIITQNILKVRTRLEHLLKLQYPDQMTKIVVVMNPKQTFTMLISDYCIAKYLNPESQFAFSSRLTKEFGFLSERKMKDKSRDFYWIGIKLKDWKKAEEGQETF